MVNRVFHNDAVRYIEDLRVEKYRAVSELPIPRNDAEEFALGLELMIRRVTSQLGVAILPYRVQLYTIFESVRVVQPGLAPGYLALVIEEEKATAREMGGVANYHKWLSTRSPLERQIGYNFVR